MKAFIVKLEQLFKMDTGYNDEISNFCQTKRKLLIPLYQREYIWTDEKIITLVKDINRCNKYLGNIILDEKDLSYEIVDGQQRITTCFLVLACLYNFYVGHQREQRALMSLMKPYNYEYILKNDSIGNYLIEQEGVISVSIEPERDIYYQSEDFQRAFVTIEQEINQLVSHERIHEFKQKLLDCEILVLINDQHNHTHPVEQLFLDINEKAQLLQVEDIFKGHCFENYHENSHDDLRGSWVELKKCAMSFKKFGFKDASQYIYLYLLETDNLLIPKNLTIGGKHYLDGKTMDDTEEILREMIIYGQATIKFYNSLFNADYRFVDLCSNSNEYRNTNDHFVLKQMCRAMLEQSAAIYQKLPLMYLIYSLNKSDELVNSLRHAEFRKIITNLYVYMMLFVLEGSKKSKTDIDHTIRNAVDGENNIGRIIHAAKEMRIRKVREFSLQNNYAFDKLAFIYSIIDQYVSNDNWVKCIYSHDNEYSLEHFIIPDNRNRKVFWRDNDKSFNFVLPIEIVSSNKKKTINYLIINRYLNESMENIDIVSKIEDISQWYERRNVVISCHINKVITHIEQMPSYQLLKNIKGNEYEQHFIESSYIEFINDYFDPDNSIHKQIEEAFIEAFQNI